MIGFRIRPVPALLGYPILGATAGCLIVLGVGALLAYYAVAFYPIPFIAAGLGLAAARAWRRRAQLAFVGGCLGVMVGCLALTPFGTTPRLLLPAMGLGLAIGVGIGLRVRR